MEDDEPASQSDELTVSVEFSISLYSATAYEPAPITSSGLYIRLDAGASVVFTVEAGSTVSLTGEGGVTATLGGVELPLNQATSVTEQTALTIVNPTGEMSIFTISVK